MSAPERIWAVSGVSGIISFNDYDNGDQEYVRADIASTEADALRVECEILRIEKHADAEAIQSLVDDVELLRGALKEVTECLDGEPEYHDEGMGCGVEDRNITDRYEAAAFGWEQAMGRVYSEHINGALEAVRAALKEKKP